MKQSIQETIETFDAKLLDHIARDHLGEGCKDASCNYCQLKKKLKGAIVYSSLNDPEYIIRIMTGQIAPANIYLYLKAFMHALQYVEIKELERLVEEKK